MEVLRIALLAIAAALLALLLNSTKRGDFALLVTLVAGVTLLGYIVTRLSGALEAIQALAERGRIDGELFTTVLKVISIAYIAEFGGQVCRDAGQGSLAQKVELGGKVAILLLAVPILSSLMDLILTLLP